MENSSVKGGRPAEAGLGLNVIETTRFSRQEFDRIAQLSKELRMSRSEVIRRSVGFGIKRLATAMRKFTAI
jgi:hypothetical protein